MNRKPFSQKDYDESNQITINVAIEFLQGLGYFKNVIPQEGEAYKDYDFIIEYAKDNENTKAMLVEVERKLVWTQQGRWQGYQTLDVPYRKKDSKSHIYIMVNRWFDTLALIKMNDVIQSNTYNKNTRHSSGQTHGETFFAVPLSKVIFFHKKGKYWGAI